MINIFRIAALLSVILLVIGCDDEKVILRGKREAILVTEHSLKVDKQAASEAVSLPKPLQNSQWIQESMNQEHNLSNIDFNKKFNLVWKTSLEYEPDSFWYIASPPVSGEGKVFIADAGGAIYALSLKSGNLLWKSYTNPVNKGGSLSGGMAYDNERLFFLSSYGKLFCFNSKSGKILWIKNIGIAGSLAVSDARLYVLCNNNKLEVFAQNTGDNLWSHAGLFEDSKLLGNGSCAIHNGTVIVPYSSGEIFALQEETGNALWSDALSRTFTTDVVVTFPHLRASPVVVDDTVYAVSYSSTSSAFELLTGQKKWEVDIGGLQAPVVASNSVFIINPYGDLACLDNKTGKAKWLIKIKVSSDPAEILFSPILTKNELMIIKSSGKVLFVSALTGKKIRASLIEPLATSPIIVNKKLILITKSGEVAAYQ